MKIIKYGNLPVEKEYQHDCENCGTRFSFVESEANVLNIGNELFLTIRCAFPKCHTIAVVRNSE